VLDKVIPENNTWRLIKYTDGITGEKINQEDITITGNQVLSGGKSFITGEILRPGTYYANLTVIDTSGKSDSTQSETVQVTLPTQKLLVHASFSPVIASDDSSLRGGSEEPTKQSPYGIGGVFEYDSNNEVKIQFNSLIDIRSNKQPKNIIYSWDFGDDTCHVIASGSEAIPNDCTSPNPIHIYKKSNNVDTVDYHPELTVTAIWEKGYSESWSSKAGTVSIIDKPEFVALDILPSTTIGNAPLIVDFMIGENSIVKNSIIASYEFYATVIPAEAGIQTEAPTDSDVIASEAKQSPSESGVISNTTTPESSLNELKQKTFTFTYATTGEFNPQLIVKTKEGKEFTFNSPIISTNQLLVSGIKVLSPLDGVSVLDPIQTIELDSSYINPLSSENRLLLHLFDDLGNETITELDPKRSSQTISLSEGLNTYWFELIDSLGATQKSLSRRVVLDNINPALNLTSPNESIKITNGNLVLAGTVIDENFEKVEYKIDSDEPITINELDTSDPNEVSFYKELSGIGPSEHKLFVSAYDKAGNTDTKELFIGNGGRISKVIKSFLTSTNELVNLNGYGITEQNVEPVTIRVGEPFSINSQVCVSDNGPQFDPTTPTNLNLSDYSFTVTKDGSTKTLTNAFLNNGKLNAINQYPDIDSGVTGCYKEIY
ncbi:MAG: hypothetical protein HYR97_04175, partial [Candidatus Melainabacteria bacterium]|nr:hypothetical protein [Candidatus Melainabacteria bacterium]